MVPQNGAGPHVKSWIFALGLALAAGPAAAAIPNIIPQPVSATQGEGSFTVTTATKVRCAVKSADCIWVARYFTDLVKRARGLQLAKGGKGAQGAIVLHLSPGMAPEAYSLDVTPAGATITASARAGLLYGAVSLWQLMTQ